MRTSELALGTSKVLSWSTVASNNNADNYHGYFVDTSAGAYSINLPANPQTGYTVAIGDGAGNASGNNITVGRNGSLINGSASDYVISEDDEMITFTYSGATVGWKAVSTVQAAAADTTTKQNVYATTGVNNSGATNATEEYDFSSWAAGTSAGYSPYYALGKGRGDYLCLGGGYVGSKSSQNWSEYDGTTWYTRTSMPSPPREQACSVVLGTVFYAAYGFNYAASSVLQDCDSWDGSTWSSETNGLTPARRLPAGFALSTSIYTTGGYDGSSNALSDVDAYDGSSWSSQTSFSPARYGHSGGTLGTTGYVAYGIASSFIQDCDSYDGSSWSAEIDALGPARGYCPFGAARHRLAAVGGYGSTRFSDVDAYDEANWTSLDSYPNAISAEVAGGV